MSFWQLSSGDAPKGDAESSHLGNFGLIPDGTQAPAMIKDFLLDDSGKNSVYTIHWKIVDGEFKSRVVFHKIKCFDPKDSIRDRSLNMLKRIYDLLGQKPTHSDMPTTNDLAPMKGQILGIKIGEWHQNGDDGVYREGNHITEVHKADSAFETITGIKNETVGHPVESALSRNSRVSTPPLDNSDIPF